TPPRSTGAASSGQLLTDAEVGVPVGVDAARVTGELEQQLLLGAGLELADLRDEPERDVEVAASVDARQHRSRSSLDALGLEADQQRVREPLEQPVHRALRAAGVRQRHL